MKISCVKINKFIGFRWPIETTAYIHLNKNEAQLYFFPKSAEKKQNNSIETKSKTQK